MPRPIAFLSVTLMGTLSIHRPEQHTPRPPVDLRASVDSAVGRRIAADSFSGAVLVARNGQVIYERAAGIANRETRTPMTIGTRFQIASTTKLFTQIAIRQLEQAGKLSLSDTVGRFLPNYPNPVVRSKVTVDQLLRHRSGVGSFWNKRFIARRADIRTVQDYMELFQDDSLLFEPGTSEAYSNGGFVLLGAIIERVSGKSYQDYLQERVFGPAGMTQTTQFDRRVALKDAAVGYTTQMLDIPLSGDRRLAGAGPRPGYEQPREGRRGDSQPSMARAIDSTGAGGGRTRLRIIGPDGRELSAEEARLAVARRTSEAGALRPNTDLQPGMSGPAGDHYSTVRDFLALANALTSHRLLDSAHTAAVLGARFAAGGAGDFRANGGGPGVNAEFSIYPSGDVVVVLSNYDPPAATVVAGDIRQLLGSAPVRPDAPTRFERTGNAR